VIVGCYTLDLYCDHPHDQEIDNNQEHYGDHLAQFTGRTETGCIQRARAAGWSINKSADRVMCPRHRRATSASR